MVSEALSPVRKGYPYAVTRGGLTYVFETAEEQAAFLAGPSFDRAALAEDILASLHKMNADLLERTGGKGISEEDMQDALATMRDH